MQKRHTDVSRRGNRLGLETSGLPDCGKPRTPVWLGTSSSPGNPYLSSPSSSVPTEGLEEGKCLATGNLIPERSPHRNQSFRCPWPGLAEEPAEGGNTHGPDRSSQSAVGVGGPSPYYSSFGVKALEVFGAYLTLFLLLC